MTQGIDTQPSASASALSAAGAIARASESSRQVVTPGQGGTPHATFAAMETYSAGNKRKAADTPDEAANLFKKIATLEAELRLRPQFGQLVHFDVQNSMRPIVTNKSWPEHKVRDAQDPVIVKRQLTNSATRVPVGAKGIWAASGSDHMLIQPRPGHPGEKYAFLELNSKGSAGTSYYGEQLQEILQRTDAYLGERLLDLHGCESLTMVLASGSAAKPTRWSREKFEVTITGVTTPARNKYGSVKVLTLPYVPSTFEKNIGEDRSMWFNNQKTTVVGMPMDDSMRVVVGPQGWEARNPSAAGEYELFFHGRQVNCVVGDGGLAQLEAKLSVAMGKEVRIDPTRCLIANPTSKLGNDKFTAITAMNDFQNHYGHEYPFYAKSVEAYLAKNDEELEHYATKLFNTKGAGKDTTETKQPIFKADNGRWGKGNLICKSQETLQAHIQEFRTMLDSINPPGEEIAGRNICVTETFRARPVEYGPNAERAQLSGCGGELRVFTSCDYSSTSPSRSGGEGVLKSTVAECKLHDPQARTANQSESASSHDATFLTQPMNKEGYEAIGSLEGEGDQLAKMMSQFVAFCLANRDFYQLRDTRTSALDLPSESLKYPTFR
jgi:hypothetical protein